MVAIEADPVPRVSRACRETGLRRGGLPLPTHDGRAAEAAMVGVRRRGLIRDGAALAALAVLGGCVLAVGDGDGDGSGGGGGGRRDPDDNPPGRRGGPGTNWENPPGPKGGPGKSPDR
jgi:hypothetical protein